MEQKKYTSEEKFHNCLLRICKCCEFTPARIHDKSNWELEDMILQRLDQGKLAKKRGLATIKNLQREIDVLRQVSIFDFLTKDKEKTNE